MPLRLLLIMLVSSLLVASNRPLLAQQQPLPPTVEQQLDIALNQGAQLQIDTINYCQLRMQRVVDKLQQVAGERDVLREQLKQQSKPVEEKKSEATKVE